MKKLIAILCMLALCAGAFAEQASNRSPLMAADTVIWAGLDYSLVRMIGPDDFRDSETIFPGMLESWNSLFLKERIVKLGATLKKRVVIDVAGVGESNKRATAKQIISTPGPDDGIEKSHISAADLARAVKSYKMDSKSGLGLVFIVDRLVKSNVRGAVYVVFFDVATREVIASERQVHPAGGFGFRNFWFAVIKHADSSLKQYR